MNERINNPLLHHKVREFHTQLQVYEKLCIAVTELNDPLLAFSEIDRVLDAADRFKRPVYIEIPRDMVSIVPPIAHGYRREKQSTEPLALAEAVREASERLQKAERPVIIAGIEIHRFNLQEQVLKLAEEARIPLAATLLGKSVVPEKHPLYIGLYEGAMGKSEVTEFVEDSDCVLLLGAFMTDINLGIYTAKLDVSKCIYVTSEQLQVSHHFYHQVSLEEFLNGLIASKPRPTVRDIPEVLRPKPSRPFEAQPNEPLKISRMIKAIDQRLDEDTIVIADIGDSLFAATELCIHQSTDFLSPAYYTSMGFSVPAAVGACFAKPDKRVLVLCGDGAFQMTGNELSTLVRNNFSPILIILDNHGYGTERYLHAGEWKYNEILPWNYYRLPELYGRGKGYLVQNEGEFLTALDQAWNDRSGVHIIHAKLVEGDASKTLLRLAERLGARVAGGTQ